MYSIQLNPDVSGVATFQEKFWTGSRWDIFPNVGVRHQGINRALFALSDLPKSDRALGLLRANLLANIGYLTPARAHRTWSFPLGVDPQPIVEDLVATIGTYGLPFTRSLSEPETFREALESGQYSLTNQDRDLAVFYVVQGDRTTAETCLRRGLEERANRHDPEADEYRVFVARVRNFLDERKGKGEGSAPSSREGGASSNNEML